MLLVQFGSDLNQALFKIAYVGPTIKHVQIVCTSLLLPSKMVKTVLREHQHANMRTNLEDKPAPRPRSPSTCPFVAWPPRGSSFDST